MRLILQGAATLVAALLAVAPMTAAAEGSPLGAELQAPAEGASNLSNDILVAMLAPPSPIGGQSLPLGGSIVPVCHRSAGGCDDDGGSGGGGGSTSPSTLKFPSPRGKVIFQHNWSSGDIPSSFERPGGGVAGTRFANKKFRLATKPDGRFKIVTDSQTGTKVLDILVTRADEARFRTHHTEIEVNIPNYWESGRFMKAGERYLLEYWRKNVNYKSDSKWEIWWQNHSMFDSTAERGRNPSVAISAGRRGEVRLAIRADSKATSYKRDGFWTYTRESTYNVGSNNSSAWELWQMEIKVDYRKGALHLWRNGKLIHSEEGLPVGYNDRRGPPWSLGWYKYFRGSSVDQRQAYIGPIRVQKL